MSWFQKGSAGTRFPNGPLVPVGKSHAKGAKLPFSYLAGFGHQRELQIILNIFEIGPNK
jgi:hypothetical protein